jgi:hypothetical protein
VFEHCICEDYLGILYNVACSLYTRISSEFIHKARFTYLLSSSCCQNFRYNVLFSIELEIKLS